MKAAVYHAPDDLRYEELDDPRAGPGEIVVRMTRCGLCGTDLGKIRYGTVPAGTVLGHQLLAKGQGKLFALVDAAHEEKRLVPAAGHRGRGARGRDAFRGKLGDAYDRLHG